MTGKTKECAHPPRVNSGGKKPTYVEATFGFTSRRVSSLKVLGDPYYQRSPARSLSLLFFYPKRARKKIKERRLAKEAPPFESTDRFISNSVDDGKQGEAATDASVGPVRVIHEGIFEQEITPPVLVSETAKLLKRAKAISKATHVRVGSQFERTVASFNKSIIDLERQARQFFNSPSPERETLIERKFGGIRKLADELFYFFCTLLGLRPRKKGFTYNKPEFDDSIERCFGSMDKRGSGKFTYRDIEIEAGPKNNQLIFSLYLGRKVFCPANPLKNPEALRAFFGRVLRPPRETELTRRAVHLFRKCCWALFDSPDFPADEYFPVHDSGCVESTKLKGGKRSVFWYRDQNDFEQTRYDVSPVAIYTGGKIRVITKDSAYNLRYAFLNRWMAGKIRSCRWSIFGRSVSEWLDSNEGFISLDGDFLSGDLESATDLFNPVFARIAIDRCAEVWELTAEDVRQMRAFTTDAVFSQGRQLSGQLMGSILSFPILCLVSFVAGIMRTPSEYSILAALPHKTREVVRKVDHLGVNGDDIILKTHDPSVWQENVESVGGRVSRGKSLYSSTVFTVNSELWTVLNGQLIRPGAIRPSVVLSLAGDQKFPQRVWDEYARSPLLSSRVRRFLAIDEILNVDLPVSLGGTGQVPFRGGLRDVTDSQIRRVLRYTIFRENQDRVIRVTPPGFSPERVELGPQIPCLVKKELAEAMKGLLNPYAPTWFKKGASTLSLDQADQMARRQMNYLTSRERELIREKFVISWVRERQGLLVKKVPTTLAKLFGCAPVREKVLQSHGHPTSDYESRFVGSAEFTPACVLGLTSQQALLSSGFTGMNSEKSLTLSGAPREYVTKTRFFNQVLDTIYRAQRLPPEIREAIVSMM